VAFGTVTCDVRLWAVPLPAAYGDAQEVAEPFQLDRGGADAGSTLSLSATPEPCDIR